MFCSPIDIMVPSAPFSAFKASLKTAPLAFSFLDFGKIWDVDDGIFGRRPKDIVPTGKDPFQPVFYAVAMSVCKTQETSRNNHHHCTINLFVAHIAPSCDISWRGSPTSSIEVILWGRYHSWATMEEEVIRKQHTLPSWQFHCSFHGTFLRRAAPAKEQSDPGGRKAQTLLTLDSKVAECIQNPMVVADVKKQCCTESGPEMKKTLSSNIKPS